MTVAAASVPGTPALRAAGTGAGLDVVEVASAEPFVEVRRTLERRKAEGLHGGMAFTYRQPARSTDPERGPAGRARPGGGGPELPRGPAAGHGRRPRRADRPLRLGRPLRPAQDRAEGGGRRPQGARLAGSGAGRRQRHGRSRCGAPRRHRVVGQERQPAAAGPRAAGTCWARSSPTRPWRCRADPSRTAAARARAASRAAPPVPSPRPGVVDARRCLSWLLQAEGPFPRRACGSRSAIASTAATTARRSARPTGVPPPAPPPARSAPRRACSTCSTPTTPSCSSTPTAGTSRGARCATCDATPWSCSGTSATAATRRRRGARSPPAPPGPAPARATPSGPRAGSDARICSPRSSTRRIRSCWGSWRPRPMTHLFVTNDFPPKIGGIQTMLWELWRRLDPSSFAVLTTRHPDSAAWDAGPALPRRAESASPCCCPRRRSPAGSRRWPTRSAPTSSCSTRPFRSGCWARACGGPTPSSSTGPRSPFPGGSPARTWCSATCCGARPS